MITVTLYGIPASRRYQKMKKLVLDESTRLSLPRLYINDKLVASQNPPHVEQITKMLAQEKL